MAASALKNFADSQKEAYDACPKPRPTNLALGGSSLRAFARRDQFGRCADAASDALARSKVPNPTFCGWHLTVVGGMEFAARVSMLEGRLLGRIIDTTIVLPLLRERLLKIRTEESETDDYVCGKYWLTQA